MNWFKIIVTILCIILAIIISAGLYSLAWAYGTVIGWAMTFVLGFGWISSIILAITEFIAWCK